MENGRVVIRPVRMDDLKIVCAFGDEVGVGFTFLLNNPIVMTEKIEKSLFSFQETSKYASKHFFFVMEFCDPLSDRKEVIGTCAIDAPYNKKVPFYNYKIVILTQISEKLKKNIQHKILELATDYQNMSQLSTLFLKKAFRGYHHGEFLSRVRCLFIAEFPHFFSDIIFGHMRGLLDENNISLFWESLGHHFFKMSLKEANVIRAAQGDYFIAELMPNYPIYIELFSKKCQEIIAKPHIDTRSALHLLEKEGFKYRGCVDVFDSGPIVEVNKSELRTSLETKVCKVQSIKKLSTELGLKMISNTHLDFRATLGAIECIEPERVCLDEAVAIVLNVCVGDNVRFCDLHKQP